MPTRVARDRPSDVDVRAASHQVRLEGSAYGRPMTHEVTVVVAFA